MKRVSTARAKQLREYAKLKREFLQTHDDCCRCKRWVPPPCRELHHYAGRAGRMLTWVPDFRMACPDCHRWIHDNPKQSRLDGLIAPKGFWNDFERAKLHYLETTLKV